MIWFHDGEHLTVRNGMGMRDIGDLWGHIIADPVPPAPDGGSIFFRASDVARLIDPETGAMLAEQTPAPGEF